MVGILLIVLGILFLAYQGVAYTRENSIVHLGPIQATEKTQDRIPLPPIVGGITLIGGVARVRSRRRHGRRRRPAHSLHGQDNGIPKEVATCWQRFWSSS